MTTPRHDTRERVDCLIIGQHDPDFERYLKTIRFTFGRTSGTYQDQDLTCVTYKGRPHRLMDLLNVINGDQLARPMSNIDFLWPTILVLGSYLGKHGMSFDYINQFKYEQRSLREKVQTKQFLTVAISTTLYVTDTPIKEITSLIRQYDASPVIVVGGPYIYNRCVDNTLENIEREFDAMGADVLVNNSEGQQTLVKLIRALRDGTPLEVVDNIIFRKDLRERITARSGVLAPTIGAAPAARPASMEQAVLLFTPKSVEDNPLEENLVNLQLFPAKDLNGFVSVATAKSCPYACAFCNFPARGGAYKYLDVASVEKQLDRVRDAGIHTVTFLDDTFNVPKVRFKELLRMMIRNKYGFKWNSFYRSDQGDEETIALMAESGCEGVFLGVESASDEMLKRMNKTSRKKHYVSAIQLLRRYGIYAHANFVIGFPGETEETLRESIDFVREYKPDTYKAQLWYFDNTAPVWKLRDEYKIQGFGFNWSHVTMDSTEASKWIDYMYEHVTESAFLPEEGFGIWCIFYLQRLGMPRSQILTFLKTFGEGVLWKRKDQRREEIPDELATRLFTLGRLSHVPSSMHVEDRASTV